MPNQITSHFVGISLQSEKFAYIFVEIKTLLWENSQNIIEFYNPLSLHITLYYFPNELSNRDLNTIEKIISEIDVTKIHIKFWWVEYFWDKIAYIWYQNIQALNQINQIFKQIFIEYNTILDNSYEKFIPHTTLFKIKNHTLYWKYKDKIETIIRKNLEKNDCEKSMDTIFLYAVNSNFSPELQIKILGK